MPTVIEVDVNTGIRTEREMLANEISNVQDPDLSVPAVIDALQGLLALDQAGYASFYESWASSPDRTFAQRAFINKALTWKRNDPTLNAAAADLGLSSAQVDQLFQLASTL